MSGSQYTWILNGISLMLTFGVLAGTLLQNVALNKKAVQSSQANSLGAAGGAVDGNKDVRYNKGSCTFTKYESDPWWRVDLENVYKITAVTITNRNSHENRLNGAEIWIGNSVETNDVKKIRCAVISHIPASRTFYFPCSGAEGRYVTVLLPGSNKTLSICEVEVFPTSHVHPLPNVALNGKATQSSTAHFGTASKAIDGRRNSFFQSGSCSHTTEFTTNPWWRVDLQQIHIVSSVKITNRGDCCAERLDGAEIRIGNSLTNNGNSNSRCATISHITAGKTNTYYCDGGSMDGRYVNVIIPGEMKILTLCEVEVYASPSVEPLVDVAFMKPAHQSYSIYSLGSASNAVSGCRSGVYNDGCCSRTTLQSSPWWIVDLLAVHKVTAVSIMGRRDCCAARLTNAQIQIGNFQTSSDYKKCGVIPSPVGLSAHTFDCAGMEGRYVRVIIPTSSYVALCSVEVFASLAEPEATTPSPPTDPPPPPLPPGVSVLLGGRNVTVVGERLCWSDALFFCRHHHWDLLSLRSQEEQSEVEQLLSSNPFPLTDYVWLGLRRYLMHDRWFWMSNDSMKFTKWPLDFAPQRYSNPCGGMATGGLFLWEDQPCEEPLNFICQSDAEQGAERVYFDSTKRPTTPGNLYF